MYSQFAVLFGMLGTGYLLRRVNFIDDKMNHGLNKFIVYFAYPCLIAEEIGSLKMTMSLALEFLLMLGASLACFAIYCGWAYIYGKARKFPRDISGVAEFAMISPNNGFMGFSIAAVFFGSEAFFLMIAHSSALNFVFFSYGLYLLHRDRGEKREKITAGHVFAVFGKVLINPNIVALVLGFLISVSGWRFSGVVGETIATYLGYMGRVATPMAMVFIGSTLTKCHIKDILKKRVVWESSLNKLILLPALTILMVYWLPIPPLVKAMLVLGTSFPQAATVCMLAEQENNNKELATMIMFETTVLSVITLPIAIEVINRLFL